MNLDVEQLLTIDVDSEIRKLAEAELGGSWQIPAELVRRALRAGATKVTVEILARAVRVHDDGPELDPETIASLATLLEPTRPPAQRHRALLELEAKREVGLIALAGLQPSALRIAAGGRALLVRGHPASPPHRQGVAIDLEGVRLDVPQARRWLKTAVRFAPAAVVIDGTEVERGSDDAIVGAELVSPLEGTVAILRGEKSGRVWLLRWGVVVTHTALADGLTVEAAVELGERLKGQIGAGELRHAFKGELTEVAEQAADLAIETASDMPRLKPEDRIPLRALLLGSSNLAKSAGVRRVKMLPALYGPTHELEWMSIDQLVRVGAGKTVLAVDDESKAADAVTQAAIFVLTTSERARLSSLFSVAFGPPPKGPGLGPMVSLKGAAESAARVGRAAAGLVSATWQRSLPAQSLTEAERHALGVFREAAARAGKKAGFSGVELCRGDGAPHLRGKPKTLMLPRENPDVIAAVKVVTRNAAWAYPALVALLGGEAMPPSAARDAWITRG